MPRKMDWRARETALSRPFALWPYGLLESALTIGFIVALHFVAQKGEGLATVLLGWALARFTVLGIQGVARFIGWLRRIATRAGAPDPSRTASAR